MTTPTDPADAITQPELLPIELPEYHGTKPVGMRTGLSGAGTRVNRAHTLGDRVVLVIEAKVKSAAHEDTDDGLIYVEKLKVIDLFELDRDQGSRLLSTVRSIHRSGEDAARGRRPVPELGDIGYTDASGVVLTPDEVAQLRGDPIRAILSPDLTPVVVVYDDGARDLWPDDYPKDTVRPKPGDTFLSDAGDVVVMQLLDHTTGETIATLDAGEIRNVTGTVELHVDTDAPPAEADEELPDNVRTFPTPAEIPELPNQAPGDAWEDPDPATADRISHTDYLPSPADFLTVDCQVAELVEKLKAVHYVESLRRLHVAEEQGRGRGLKPRAGALTAIENRIAQVESLDAAERAR